MPPKVSIKSLRDDEPLTSFRSVNPHTLVNSTTPTHDIHGRKLKHKYPVPPPVTRANADHIAAVKHSKSLGTDLTRKIFTPALNDIADRIRARNGATARLTSRLINMRMVDVIDGALPLEVRRRLLNQDEQISSRFRTGDFDQFAKEAIQAEFLKQRIDAYAHENPHHLTDAERNSLRAGRRIPEMHKGGMVKKTAVYKLQKGELVVPKDKVAVVKKAMKKKK